MRGGCTLERIRSRQRAGSLLSRTRRGARRRDPWLVALGLAGPLWGLGATGAALLGYLASGNLLWAAIAHLSALINLFNLVPIWQLDGSRGFVALSRYQRWLLVLALAFAYLATQEGLLVLVLIVAAGRALIETAPQEPDHGALGLFAALVVGLSVIAVSLPTPAM